MKIFNLPINLFTAAEFFEYVKNLKSKYSVQAYRVYGKTPDKITEDEIRRAIVGIPVSTGYYMIDAEHIGFRYHPVNYSATFDEFTCTNFNYLDKPLKAAGSDTFIVICE